MKKMILLLTLVTSQMALAGDLSLFCDNKHNLESCRQTIEITLQQMNCQIDTTATICQLSLTEEGKDSSPYCDIKSLNCSQPIIGLMGGDSCAEGRMIKTPRSAGFNNGYYYSVFKLYSRNICIK